MITIAALNDKMDVREVRRRMFLPVEFFMGLSFNVDTERSVLDDADLRIIRQSAVARSSPTG